MLHLNLHHLRRALCLLPGTFLLAQPAISQSVSGTYTLNSLATGHVLDGNQSSVYALGANNGANQTWFIQATDVVAGGQTTYTVRSSGTGLCLDGDGGRLYPSACNGGNYQKWIIEPTDPSGYAVLTSVATGKVLDSNGKDVYPSDRNGGSYQKWRLTPTGRRTYPALQGRTEANTQIGTAVSTAPPARNTAPPAPADPRRTHRYIGRAMSFMPGSSVESKDRRFQVYMQEDGNMVLYRLTERPKKALWASNTAGRAVKSYVFQDDGNMVIYDRNDQPIWASNTDGRGEYMLLQNDGNLVIYNRAHIAIWATNTGQ